MGSHVDRNNESQQQENQTEEGKHDSRDDGISTATAAADVHSSVTAVAARVMTHAVSTTVMTTTTDMSSTSSHVVLKRAKNKNL